jgi:hypothetical protein
MSIEPFIAGGFTIAALGIQQWMMHRQNVKAGEARDAKLNFVLTEHVPHTHSESGEKTPLLAGGINYPKTKFNGGS